ncbi:MAG: SRPBCC domain-containing protein [Pseudomonadota bacterium]
MHNAMAHSTVTFERTFAARRDRLFDAWRDPAKRAIWGAPFDGVEITYTEVDFRQGGRDVCECVAGDERFDITTHYFVIDDGSLIVSSETLVIDDTVQGVTLISAEFFDQNAGSRLALTLQTVGIGGSGFETELEDGWRHALDAMALLLGRFAPQSPRANCPDL